MNKITNNNNNKLQPKHQYLHFSVHNSKMWRIMSEVSAQSSPTFYYITIIKTLIVQSSYPVSCTLTTVHDDKLRH